MCRHRCCEWDGERRASGVIAGLVHGRSAGTVCSGATSGRAGGLSIGFVRWCGGGTARIVGGMVGISGGKMCGRGNNFLF
jgi:hypothetical protein